MEGGIPDQIGKYAVKGLLGRGATSAVYRAHDAFRNCDVAIKLMDSRIFERDADPLARTGFMVEASLVGKLDHPHVAKLFDVVSGPEQHYVVMEYIPGGTLEKYCKPGELMDHDSAVDVVFKVAKALEHVHGLGLVHRDIKPANILIQEGTDIRLADFGAAFSKSLASTQEIKAGSPFYMSPEQIGGGDTDFRSDMYSLGVVLYQLLTGELPFRASSMESLAYQIANREPERPARIHEGVPAHVDGVVMRALSKDPGDRFESWEAFNAALADQAALESMAAGDISVSSETERFRLLRRCAFFSLFGDSALWEVIENTQFRRVVEGDVLMREGEIGDGFFVILAGQVRVTKRGRLLDVMSPGVSFGELSYILRGKLARNASCAALTDAIVLRVEDSWLSQAPMTCKTLFERAFLGQLAHRLIDANARLSQM